MKEKDRSSHCCSNCVNVPKLADARKENKDRSSHCRSNCINVPKLADARKKIRHVVFAPHKLRQYL